jgi:uncharacterized protein (TIGR00369 family)
MGLSAKAIERFLSQAFPETHLPNVLDADGTTARLSLAFAREQLRPGGTLSGPTLMALADTAMYALVLSAVGPLPLAVTTNLSINFLKKPQPLALIAEAQMLRLGRVLAVGAVSIRSEGDSTPCAHAVVTYAIPPQPTEGRSPQRTRERPPSGNRRKRKQHTERRHRR